MLEHILMKMVGSSEPKIFFFGQQQREKVANGNGCI
jgi:hypothetical protein